MKKFLAVILILLPIGFAPVPATAACTSSTSSGSVKVGSMISNGSVVVCASTSTTGSNKTAKVSTIKKVVAPVKVVPPPPPPCVIKVPTAAAAYGLYLSGCTVVVVAPVVKVVPKVTATTAVTAATQTDQAAFTPNPVGISASPSIGLAGQAFFFSAIASSHTKNGTVLGKPATVSFTPVSFDWSSDSGGGAGSSFATSWQTDGSHGVGLTVTYAVSYSVGAGWIDAGSISASSSATVQVVSVTAAPAPAAALPLLVSANCRDHPSSYRC